MYIKKIVGTTVDKLTLSYVEKHLKEAIEQEHGIPTTVLSVIAEKSFNEYNLKSISTFLEKSFKLDYKEWKKFRNLLKIIEYLLKFGSNEFVLLAKQHQGDIRSLQNYSFSEGGSERGSAIRESALYILMLLNNSRELELARDESRRHREKFTGISSNPAENKSGYSSGYGGSGGSGGYSAPGGYGGGYSTGYGGYSESNYSENPRNIKNEGFLYSESQKKFAESVFGGKPEGSYQGPELYSQSIGPNRVEKEDWRYERPSNPTRPSPDIFSIAGDNRHEKGGFRAPDLFASDRRPQENDSYQDVSRNREVQGARTKAPDLFESDMKGYASTDIFAPKDPVPPKQTFDILGSSSQPIQTQGSNLFSNMKMGSNNKSPDLFSQNEPPRPTYSNNDPRVDPKPAQNPNIDIFSLSNQTVAPQKPDLFSTTSVKSDQNTSIFGTTEKTSQKPIDLFANVSVKDSKPAKNNDFNSDIFGISNPDTKVQNNYEMKSPTYSSSNRDLFELNEKTSYTNQGVSSLVPGNSYSNQGVNNLLSGNTYSNQGVSSLIPGNSYSNQGVSSLIPGNSYSNQGVSNLLTDLKITETKSTTNSMFSGMVQKRPNEGFSDPNKVNNKTGLGLEGLNFDIGSSSSNTLSHGAAPMNANIGMKIKSNLMQTEEKPKPEPVKKTSFNPSEFEAKLFSLDI